MVSHTPQRPDAGESDGAPPTPPTTPPRTTTRFHQWVDDAVETMLSWGWLTILIGLAPGMTMWTLAQSDREFVIENDLAVRKRMDMLEWMVASMAVVALVYLGVWAYRRFRGRREQFADVAHALNRYAFLLTVTPFIGALAHRGIETKHRFITLLLCGGIALAFGVLVYRVAALLERRATSRPSNARWRELAPVIAMVAIGAFYAWYMSSLALLDHRNLGTHIYDLGIYDNIFYRTSNGDFLGCGYCKGGKHVAAHFDPIIWVFSPIYKLNPRAETLLVLQSTWLATGVVPLFLLARRRLGNAWFGVGLAAIYAMYPALHGANMFDFHSLTLVVPSLLWAIYLLDAEHRIAYAAALAVVLITREDMSLLACFIGVYAIVTRKPITGLLTIAAALSYLYFVKTQMMPDPGLLMQGGKESMSYIYFYEDMIPHPDEGMKGLVISFFTNPIFVIKMLVIEKKVFFFLALGLPLLFLPFVSGRKTVMMAYGLVFLGLASRRHMYSLHFQYSSVLFPILLASMPDAIARASGGRVARSLGLATRRLQWTLMITAVLSTFLVMWKFGAWLSNDSFKAGWNRLARNPGDDKIERYEKTRDLVHLIPDDASVSSTSGLGPQVSNRMEVKKWPSYRDADYLLLYTKGFKRKDNRRLDRLIKRGEYRLVDGDLGVELFELVAKDERSEAREAAKDLPDRASKKKKKKKKKKKSAKKGKAAAKPRAKDKDADKGADKGADKDGSDAAPDGSPDDDPRNGASGDDDSDLDVDENAGIPVDPRAREPDTLIE